MPAHEFMELHAPTFHEHGVSQSFLKASMMLCAQASSASVAEQGACGWSKVGCIETETRTRIQTAKTNKLVNVNGWQWSLEEESKKKNGRPRTLQLFDALDSLVEEKQAVAMQAGAKEGGDDDIGASADVALDDDDELASDFDGEEVEEGGDMDAGNDEAPVGLDFDEEEWEVESDPEAYESDGPACECLPVRSAIKCNDALQAALPGIVDFRNSDFEVTRKLAFS